MPRSTPATQSVKSSLGVADLNPTAPDALGDVVDPGTYLFVDNGSGGSINVTVQTPGVEGPGVGLAVADNVVAVPAGKFAVIYLDPSLYQRPRSAGSDIGKVYVDYSAVASVTRAVFV
jgi:hypothetical protein